MSTVTKKDLVEKVASRTGLTQVDTKIVIERFLGAVGSALEQGNNVEIRGFGRFKIKERKARIARNPRTNEPVEVKNGRKPVFEAARELTKSVNDSLQNTISETAQ